MEMSSLCDFLWTNPWQGNQLHFPEAYNERKYALRAKKFHERVERRFVSLASNCRWEQLSHEETYVLRANDLSIHYEELQVSRFGRGGTMTYRPRNTSPP